MHRVSGQHVTELPHPQKFAAWVMIFEGSASTPWCRCGTCGSLRSRSTCGPTCPRSTPPPRQVTLLPFPPDILGPVLTRKALTCLVSGLPHCWGQSHQPKTFPVHAAAQAPLAINTSASTVCKSRGTATMSVDRCTLKCKY